MTTPVDDFFDTVKRHVVGLVSGAEDAMTCIAFQNLIYGMIAAFESVLEDGADKTPYLSMDEEQLSNCDGFTCDERVLIYDGGDGLMDTFRACISYMSLEKLDALEDRIVTLMGEFPEEKQYFIFAAETGELDVKYIDSAVVAASAPVPEPVPAPVPEPTPAPESAAPAPEPQPQPQPILKKARRVTRRLNRASKSTTRRVRWAP